VSCTFTNRGNQHLADVPFSWKQENGPGQLVTISTDYPNRISWGPEGTEGRIVLLNEGESVTLTWLFSDYLGNEVGVEARGPGIVARPEPQETPYDKLVMDINRYLFFALATVAVFAYFLPSPVGALVGIAGMGGFYGDGLRHRSRGGPPRPV
jgi:hypothetical protein